VEFLLNEQQVLLRDAAAKLGASKGGPRRARTLRDAKAGIDAEAWKQIVEAGWLSALAAEDRGGLGLGIFDLALALEEIGKQVVMAPLTEQASAGASWSLRERGDGIEACGARNAPARAELRWRDGTTAPRCAKPLGLVVLRAVRECGRSISGDGERRRCNGFVSGAAHRRGRVDCNHA
jgi:alkylation response protein AidB-like acyl-CoA dehydrogenase